VLVRVKASGLNRGEVLYARDLLPHLAWGAIKVPIERTFPLAEIAAAHDFAEKDSHVGKIVLTFDYHALPGANTHGLSDH
jgi:NADPH:quinone reductase-like Zn-dependent oxidoreductase